ncbi:hypothetical protein AB205_0129570 [Aquarana catesbeiana]|uniref:Uncharacterized protein n=1 Tax=Aquarana catesbeiana TaxID=8400 RepID=A0A2G9Q9P2_AQUCT|nr:hypothetical protein AB205_0129570 [Aquarana catesbeiana]
MSTKNFFFFIIKRLHRLSGILIAPLPAKNSRSSGHHGHSGRASQDGHFQAPSVWFDVGFRPQAQLSQHSWPNVSLKSYGEHSTPV